MGFYYFPWGSLDGNERYCLADTMGLVDLHRGSLDSMQDVREALGDRTMLVIPNVVEEAAKKCMELDDALMTTLDGFESAMVASLDRSGLPFTLTYLPDEAVSAAAAQYAKEEYPNKNGDPLSYVDCILLCGAMHGSNVDVLTADSALIDAVLAKCGPGRACSPRNRYYKRRRDTAWFVKVLSGAEVEWNEAGTILDYVSKGAPVATLDVSKPEASVKICRVEGIPLAGEAIRTFFMVSQLDDCCPCGADNGKFKCLCPDFRYSPCSGLDKADSHKFLGMLTPRTRDKLYAIVKSFQ